jgi:hypothetical protein
LKLLTEPLERHIFDMPVMIPSLYVFLSDILRLMRFENKIRIGTWSVATAAGDMVALNTRALLWSAATAAGDMVALNARALLWSTATKAGGTVTLTPVALRPGFTAN